MWTLSNRVQSADRERAKLEEKLRRDELATPSGPWSKSWLDLALRRAMRIAAEEGYDAIGWTTGNQQNKRYNLSTVVRSVKWKPNESRAPENAEAVKQVRVLAASPSTDETTIIPTLIYVKLDGTIINSTARLEALDGRQLSDVVGSELARKIMGEDSGHVDPRDLTIGGQGHKAFYDMMVPSAARKLGKRWSVGVERAEITTLKDTAEPIHLVNISAEMSESIKDEGLQMFGPRVPEESPAARERLAEIARDVSTIGRGIVEGAKGVGQALNRYAAKATTRLGQMADEIAEQGKGRQEEAARASEHAQALREEARSMRDPADAARKEGLADRLEQSAKGADVTADQKLQAAARVRKFARDLVTYSRLGQAHANVDNAEARKILAGLSRAELRQVALLGQGRTLSAKASPQAVKANDQMLELMDNGRAGMHRAAQLGMRRRMIDGTYVALQGSGEWYPQSLNSKGLEVVRDLGRRGINSAKLEAMAQRMVDEGDFKDLEQARRGLAQYLTATINGKNSYFEQVRIKLPTEYIDLDVLAVVERTIDRNARTVASGEAFGGFDDANNVSGVESVLGDLDTNLGPMTRRTVEDYISVELGRQKIPKANERRLVGAIMSYQVASKLGNLFTPIRNLTQPWISTADYGLVPRLRAYFEQYPLGLAAVLPHARANYRAALNAGAITGQSGFSDLPDATASSIVGSMVGLFYAPIRLSEQANQVRAFLIGQNAAASDVAKLVDLEGKNGPLRKLIATVSDPSFGKGGSRAVVTRRLERLGLTAKQLQGIVTRGGRLTPEQLEVAGWMMAHDTQFAYTSASKPLWWESNPWLRLVSQFKSFGIRQLGLMVDRGVKEAIKGNPLPLVRFGIAAIVAGELVSILKDYITGSDRAISGLSGTGGKKTSAEVATRALSQLANGGFFGALADTQMGIGDYVMGPTAGTVRDIGRAGLSIVKRPTAGQTSMALKDLVNKQFPLVRQVRGMLDRAGKTAGRAALYNTIRSRVRESEYRSFEDRAEAEVKRRTLGYLSFEDVPGTLAYRFAADSITAGDTKAAEEYLHELILNAPADQRKKTLDGIRDSLNRRAPLGSVSEGAARKYLAGLPKDEAERVAAFHRAWVGDYTTALRKAAQRVRDDLATKTPTREPALAR